MPGKLGTYHSTGLVFLLIAGGMKDGMAKIYEGLGGGAMGALYGEMCIRDRLWAELLLNFSSISLFVANLIQMCFIGKFVVNRIPFDR